MSEDAAITVLKRATELDANNRLAEALVCYQEGVQLLLIYIKEVKHEGRKKHLKDKAEAYIERAEKVKLYVAAQKEAAKKHTQMTIDEDATGWSYERIFGPCIDEFVAGIAVQDPYIRSHHQINNFLRLTEHVVLKCLRLKAIHLTTGRSDHPHEHRAQQEKLSEISASLRQHGVKLAITFSDHIHDREIRFDNGWIVKIGRGLDIFKAPQGKFHLGQHYMEYRRTLATTVDIFHRDYTRQT